MTSHFQSFLKASRLLLPVAFFGYAAVVNLGFARFPGQEDVAIDMSLLRGTLTAKVDSVYRESLPHRDPAIGMIGALRYLTVGEGRKGVITGTDGWLFTAEEIRPMHDAMTVPLARIASVQAIVAAMGAKLVIIPVPGKLDIYASHRSTEAAAGIAALYDGLLAGLTAQGTPALDARTALTTAAASQPAFFRTDTHWTPAGAEAVAEALAASGLITPGDTAFAIDRAAEKTFTGDLVSYVTTDAIAPLLGLKPEAAVPYTALPDAATGPLDIFAGAAAGSIVLVGTSYSADPTWSFAEALKLALGRDVLNQAVEGQGPLQPMLDYLASDEFRVAPPEVVIWEMPVRYLSDPAIWQLDKTEETSGA